MFEHDDDRGFWDDEPTRPLQRLTARIKPAGAPPPPATRLWPSRANAGRHHDTSWDTFDDTTRQLPVQRRTPGPALFDHQDDPDLHEPQQRFDPYDPFADVDVDFDVDAVMWPDERRRIARGESVRGGTATMTRPVVRPQVQPYADDLAAHDDNWPASVGEALLMAGRRAVQFVRALTANMSPLARRIGILVLMLLLCVPIALSLRGGTGIVKGLTPKDAPDNTTVAIGDTSVTTPAPSVSTPAAVTPATAPAVAPSAAAPTCSQHYKIVAGDYWISIAQRAGVSTKELLAANDATTKTVLLPGKSICLPAGAKMPSASSAAKSSTATAASAVATTVKAVAPGVACGAKYTIVSGDAWSLIASRAKVTTTQLLAANNATTRTVLLPGKSICLPAGASMPAPTPTTVKATATTVASTSGGIVKTRAYSQAEVQTIIRQYWPAELQDWALKQAWKESNWQNNAYNWCCYGLFQINFSAHQSWLKNYGVTSASQLLDPVINTKMAIIVYQRMGGYWPTGA